MRTSEKIMLIVAVVLIALGVVIFITAMSWSDWNFQNLSTESYETNTYSVKGEFRNISIDTKTTDIQIRSSDDGACKIVCFASEKEKYNVSVENDVLTICVIYQKNWYDYIEFMGKTHKITLYLPNDQYGDLVIRESTGDIVISDEIAFEKVDISLNTGDVFLENVAAEAVALSLSTGDVMLRNMECSGNIKIVSTSGDVSAVNVICGNFTAQGSTGDLYMKNVIAKEALFIKNSTGDVDFDACDAGKVSIQTTTGDVEGSFLSGKSFEVHSDTGDVEIPRDSTGELCRITTTTGDIEIDIRP